MPRTADLLPAAPGAYTQWPTLVGAPTHWQAAVAEADGSYVESATVGHRDSYRVTSLGAAGDDTLISLIVRGSMAWGGGLVGGNAQTTVFYRLFGADHDLADWLPMQFNPDDPTEPGPPVAMPEILIVGLTAKQIDDGLFEIGVRRRNTRKGRLHAISVRAEVVAHRERFGLVGGGRGLAVGPGRAFA